MVMDHLQFSPTGWALKTQSTIVDRVGIPFLVCDSEDLLGIYITNCMW